MVRAGAAEERVGCGLRFLTYATRSARTPPARCLCSRRLSTLLLPVRRARARLLPPPPQQHPQLPRSRRGRAADCDRARNACTHSFSGSQVRPAKLANSFALFDSLYRDISGARHHHQRYSVSARSGRRLRPPVAFTYRSKERQAERLSHTLQTAAEFSPAAKGKTEALREQVRAPLRCPSCSRPCSR